MDLGKAFRTDRGKELEGSWVDISGSEFLIARVTNRKYKNLLLKTMKANSAGLADDTTQEAEDLDIELMAGVLAETILLDWKDVVIDGKKVKYSKAAAKKAMKEMPDFLDLIRAHANSIDNFKAEEEVTEEKNS